MNQITSIGNMQKDMDLNKIFSFIINYSPNSIVVTNLEGKIIFVNKRFEMCYGYLFCELVGQELGMLNAEVNSDEIQSDIINALKNNRRWRGEILQKCKDGSTFVGDFEFFAILNRDGLSEAWVSINHNITKRKLAEEQLRQSKEQFAKVFFAGPNPMAIISTKSHECIDINEAFLINCELSRDEVVGSKIEDLYDFLCLNKRKVCEIKKTMHKNSCLRNLEICVKTKSGKLMEGLLSVDIINFNYEKCYLLVFNDLTDYKNLTREIGRLDRLNLIGQLAAGIGHEVRNPMTTVRGFLQLLSGNQEFAKHQEYFNLMIKELDRANSIITDFLSIARNKPKELERTNLNDLIANMYPLISSDALNSSKNISIKLEPVPELLLSKDEIKQLILNFVHNGLEVTPLGGFLTIQTYSKDQDVVLEIKDEGPGINKNILPKLGTPFLTTKAEGTGLGLATCYSIAERHNARVDVETTPTGTTFFIRFRQ
ncbi:PAS domain S-box protein [Desulfotomaculum sp. 1211_IL3151]|uniref:PAS domain S-box protein n=1 Tax=Desulfotomaculum sp. 1211_IL3151 TaxID=3084055 RepID=UPI002FDAA07E